LKQVNSALVLIIKDNGKGIEADDVFAPSSLGLMGMRERALVFGGELSITSKPNKGTTLTVTFPAERVFKP
jgi:signal transduction histidine kinase